MQKHAIDVLWHRRYDGYGNPAPWLVTVYVGEEHAVLGCQVVQSRAVIDDFGNLVCVRYWQ